MKCRNCGSQLDEGSKFCAFCGAAQGEEESNQLDIEKADDENNGGNDGNDAERASKPSDLQEESGSSGADKSSGKASNKQSIKKSVIFLAKCLGVYAAILLALFIVAVIVEYTVGAPSPLHYRACALVAIAFFAAIPYAIAVIVLAVIGESRRARISNLIRKIKDKKPAVFKGCVAAAVVALLVALFFLTACPHSECSPATCTTPKTCEMCGETEGEALGHSWADATCTEPKTCSRCGETSGEAKGHTPGEWSKEGTDYVAATKTTKQTCTECGKVLDSKSENVASFVDGEVFSIPANDFVKRMGRAYSSISGCSLKAEKGTLKDNLTLSLNVKSGSSTVAAAGFVEAGSKSSLVTIAFGSDKDRYWQVLFSFKSSSKSDDYAAETMYALIQTCDPSLSKDEAYEVGSEVLANYESLGSGKGMGQASRNGITYSLANSNGWMVSAKVG